MIALRFILLASFMVLFAPSLAAAATTCGPGGAVVVPSERTFSFSLDKTYTCGQYVNGHWWVLDPGTGVTITSITPSYSAGRNGHHANPRQDESLPSKTGTCTGSRSCNAHSLDKRIASNNIREAWKEPVALPHTWSGGDSILKAESVPAGDPTCTKNGCVERYTVITVVAQNPETACSRPFRPWFSNAKPKPTFCADSVDIAGKLPQLPDVTNQISIAKAEAAAGDWSAIYWCYGSDGGVCFPRSGINRDSIYGSNISLAHNEALNRTLQSGTPSQKETLVYKMIQNGIDIYGTVSAGKLFYSDGGVNAGRKGVVLFAGYMLNHASMLDLSQFNWQEDMMTYMGQTEALFGDNPQTSTCTGSGNNTGRVSDGLRDGGCADHGSLDSGQMQFQKTPAEMRSLGKFSYAPYQRYTHAQGLGVLPVIRQLGLEAAWNHPPFFQYYDRILTPPWNGDCGGYCSNYLGSMARKYSAGGPGAPPPIAPFPSATLRE